MKKSDLRTGMMVTLRNKNTYFVALNTGCGGEQDNVLVHKVGRSTGWMPLDYYDEGMCFHDEPYDILPPIAHDCDKEWDIMEVSFVRHAADLYTPEHYNTRWRRNED